MGSGIRTKAHRINQIFLEPLLAKHAARFDRLEILYGTGFESFSQDGEGVSLRCLRLASNEPLTIKCQFMIGCDGGKSAIRKQIGARFEGDPVIQRYQSTYIRAPKLLSMMPEGPAWAIFSLNPKRCGNMYAIDGSERWLIHNYLKDDEPDFDSVNRDKCIRDILGVGAEFEYEVLSTEGGMDDVWLQTVSATIEYSCVGTRRTSGFLMRAMA